MPTTKKATTVKYQDIDQILDAVKIKKPKLKYHGMANFDTEKYGLIAQSEAGETSVICHAVTKDQDYLQPAKVKKLIESDYLAEDEEIQSCYFVNKLKGIFFQVGKTASSEVINTPIQVMKYGIMDSDTYFEVHIYRGLLYRYDYLKSKNQVEEFWQLKFVDKAGNYNSIYIDAYHEGHKRHVNRIMIPLFVNAMQRDTAHSDVVYPWICRKLTSNAYSNYKGYYQLSEVPNTAASTKEKLANIHSILNDNKGKYANTTLGMFYASVRAYISTKKEFLFESYLYKDREEISEIFWKSVGVLVGLN